MRLTFSEYPCYPSIQAFRACNVFKSIFRQEEEQLPQEQLHLTGETQGCHLWADKCTIPQLMGCIQNGVAGVCLSTGKADVLIRVGVLVVWFPAGQVAVIVVLMDDHDRRCAVDDGPLFPARSVDHPVIPAGATDGEIGHIGVAGPGEEEKVGARGAVESSVTMDHGR